MPLILPKEGHFEYEEKRSRFIGRCAPASSEAQARQFIENIRSLEKGANHNVLAYSVTEGNIVRFNDDGEPSGTAGMPVLNVYERAGIIDWVCVVTRYFGGTLLGAGGLVRAYTKAAKGAMDAQGLPRGFISNCTGLLASTPSLIKPNTTLINGALRY